MCLLGSERCESVALVIMGIIWFLDYSLSWKFLSAHQNLCTVSDRENNFVKCLIIYKRIYFLASTLHTKPN
jgi:hypothetical protein